jgi:hypothetical protein
MKRTIARLICGFCRIFNIYIMVNIKFENEIFTKINDNSDGMIRYCHFKGPVSHYGLASKKKKEEVVADGVDDARWEQNAKAIAKSEVEESEKSLKEFNWEKEVLEFSKDHEASKILDEAIKSFYNMPEEIARQKVIKQVFGDRSDSEFI